MKTLFEEFFENREHIWSPGLERIKKALSELPEKDYPSIVVAGTNGKGSVSHFISECLQKQGFRVGLFTSPHLLRFNERIKVNLQEVETSLLDSAFGEILPLVRKHRLTYFESSLILALEVFRRSKVDCAVFEVGMGGKLDAVNALTHQLAVITRIGFDHTEFLGKTLTEIAVQKAGVLRKGMIGVVSRNEEEVVRVIELTGAKIFKFPADFWHEDAEVQRFFTRFLYMGQIPVEISMVGIHQADNAVTAIKSAQLFCEEFLGKHFVIPRKISVKLPGRVEVLKESPLVVFDVSHNPQAVHSLFSTISKFGEFKEVYYSGLSDKNHVENLRIARSFLKSPVLHLLELDTPRKAPFRDLLIASKLAGFEKVKKAEKIELEKIENNAVIFGSFRLASKIS